MQSGYHVSAYLAPEDRFSEGVILVERVPEEVVPVWLIPEELARVSQLQMEKQDHDQMRYDVLRIAEYLALEASLVDIMTL
jgi:hypothetical protein